MRKACVLRGGGGLGWKGKHCAGRNETGGRSLQKVKTVGCEAQGRGAGLGEEPGHARRCGRGDTEGGLEGGGGNERQFLAGGFSFSVSSGARISTGSEGARWRGQLVPVQRSGSSSFCRAGKGAP